MIDAVHAILLEKGFLAIGVNSVAERAGLNKVLIYRYFGGLEGLLDVYMARANPFPDIVEKAETLLARQKITTPDEAGRIILECLLGELSENRQFLEMLKWELSERNPMSEAIARKREEHGLLLTQLFMRFLPEHVNFDIQAVTALFTAAFFYLSMRADTVEVFNGVPIANAKGRARLIDATSQIVSALMQNM